MPFLGQHASGGLQVGRAHRSDSGQTCLLEAAGPRRMWMRSSSKSKIQFAVFPVAGRGTRFLPATKASPKEMLPIVDKPLIQYATEEALSAGATKLVFITGATKRAIADHFDIDHELEEELEKQG